MSILVGTAGYSYDDWIGPFYPDGTNKREFLDFYAQQFGLVEVNYTYYRMPAARTLAAMSDKTGPDFQFVIKANSAMTHQRDASPADFTDFAAALQPLQEADKLGCVLAQFPHSFHANSENVDYLRRFRELLPALPVVFILDSQHRRSFSTNLQAHSARGGAFSPATLITGSHVLGL